jgi:hypothetical protein
MPTLLSFVLLSLGYILFSILTNETQNYSGYGFKGFFRNLLDISIAEILFPTNPSNREDLFPDSMDPPISIRDPKYI